MCDPLTITGFAVGSASKILAFEAQQAAASARADAYNSAVKSAGTTLADQTAQEGIKVQQEQEAGVDKQLELRKEALQSKGTILASGYGSEGLSEEMLLADVDRQQANYSDIIAENMDKEAQQSYWNNQAAVSAAQSCANATRPTTGGPNPLELGVGILGEGLVDYNDYHIKAAT